MLSHLIHVLCNPWCKDAAGAQPHRASREAACSDALPPRVAGAFLHVGVEAHAAPAMDGTCTATSTAISNPAEFRRQGVWEIKARQTTVMVGGAAESAAWAVAQGEALAAALAGAFSDLGHAPSSRPLGVVSITAEPSMFPSEQAAGVTVVKVEIADKAESLEVTARKLVAEPDTTTAVTRSDIAWLLARLNAAAERLQTAAPPGGGGGPPAAAAQ